MRILHIDSFTTEPFRGNPAAVCLLEGPAGVGWMQAVAAEMNLPETAFVERRGGDDFGLRWFTPTEEAALCGHATLAAAHALWEEGEGAVHLAFDTMSGVLTAERDGDGRILLDFPAEPAERAELPGGVAEALGVDPRWAGRNRLDLLVEVADEATVRAVTPDFRALASALPGRGVIVTAASDDTVSADFVSRFFAPATGIDEDPVTGSAHCCLGPYWGAKLGQDDLVGFQASARGGFVGVRLLPGGTRVLLSGHAVTVTIGEISAEIAAEISTENR